MLPTLMLFLTSKSEARMVAKFYRKGLLGLLISLLVNLALMASQSSSSSSDDACDAQMTLVPECSRSKHSSRHCRNLEGKVVLVVGGSKGIGKATAERFAVAGCTVIATSRHPQDYPPPTIYTLSPVCLDIRDQASVINFFSTVIAPIGKIDILINVAGVPYYGPLAASTGDDMRDLFETVLFGFQRSTTAALSFMLGQEDTRVISMGTLSGEGPLESVYSIAKHAMQTWNDQYNMERILSQRLGQPINLPTFTLLEPSAVNTTFGSTEWKYPTLLGQCNPQVLFARSIGINRMNNSQIAAEDVAEAIYRIASFEKPKSRYYLTSHNEKIAGYTIPQILQIAHCEPVDKAINLVVDIIMSDVPPQPVPCTPLPVPFCTP